MCSYYLQDSAMAHTAYFLIIALETVFPAGTEKVF
jgi:hypothetical protein